jgi:Neurotransmitter-gated ion-channel ligand binding domain
MLNFASSGLAITFPQMTKFVFRLVTLTMAVLCSGMVAAAAQPAPSPAAPTSSPFVLGPPQQGGPVTVQASFEILEISAISDANETFDFTGILTFKWRDPRQAFDPATVGVKEKIFQGDYQFNEISPGWYPQIVLTNSAGSYESQGVLLRSQPDGTQILVQKVSASARSDLNLRRFPFDEQILRASFQVLGFDRSEVTLQVDSAGSGLQTDRISVPQWFIKSVSISPQDRPTMIAGSPHVASGFAVNVDIRRASFYVSRLVTLPLFVIVLLSFSVFWMEPAAFSDRMNISFIGILTAVAYQLVMSEVLPRIAYVTWMNAFLSLSFLMMVATVFVDMLVGTLDRRGEIALAHRVDVWCRWLFPLIYLGLILGAFGVTFLLL